MWTPPEWFDEYRLQRRLGRGAMGHVYMAHDTLLERDVAIKFVIAVDDPLARARFLVEARAIARLQHPNVVAVHRVGEVLGQPYIVSELVRGRTLDHLDMPVAPDTLLRIAIDLARGLSAAHRHGVLHRDVKPSNAILGDDGSTKLLDFGLAKLNYGRDDEGRVAGPRFDHEALQVLSAAETAAQSAPVGDAPGRDSQPLTMAGAVIGTPLYMAPECWMEEPLTARSDLYSLGALLFHLAAGRPHHEAANLAQIAHSAVSIPAPPIRSLVELDPRFGAIIDRCLLRTPADRFESADAICAALNEIVTRRGSKPPVGNPYRGLLAFQPEHRDVFFGRAIEIQAVVERLRVEPIVVVVGDSGAGKSSLVRAGVVPAVNEGALGGTEIWSTVVVVPGRHPLATLSDVLARHLGEDESALLARLEDEPTMLGREIGRRRDERGSILLVIDQLEELLEVSSPKEAAKVADLLSRLSGPWGFRVLATLRSDCLTRVAALGLREPLTRGLYLLPALDQRSIRNAIVDPARLCGVSFESDALVDVLVEAGRAPGSLPLLQFTLARLWEARDRERNVIPAQALEDLGGVDGALAGHADGVIHRLLPEDRRFARQILTRLVSPTGSRLRRSQVELVGDVAPRRVLEALVAARLLAAEEGGYYTLAHEALIGGWATLRGWLEADAHLEAVRDRVENAASEWLGLGEPGDMLWSARRMHETEGLKEHTLGATATRFLAASRRAVERKRLKQRAIVAAIAVAIAGLWGGGRVIARRRLDHAVEGKLAKADAVHVPAIELDRANQRARDAAFAAFDAGASDHGERLWTYASVLAHDADLSLQTASRVLEDTVALDPSRALPRRRLADTLYERALLAERTGHASAVAELLDRLERAEPGGTERRGWATPGHIKLQLSPADASLELERFELEDPRRPPHAEGAVHTEELTLAPGSYRLTARAPGHADVRIPFEVRRGEDQTITIALPRTVDMPEGFVYIPAGEVYTGSSADEILRKSFLEAAPIHRHSVGAFLIARDETTFAQWIEFLESLSDKDRATRLPRSGVWGVISLTRLAVGRYRLSITPNDTELHAESGQLFEYPGRIGVRRKQDWTKFPVTGISLADAEAYARWLDTSGRVKGARVCTELEWQRAARGADDRLYPHGDQLLPGEANFLPTHGETNCGPDEVGSFPASQSLFGLDDLVGNAWELTRTVGDSQVASVRGGGANSLDLECRVDNRVKSGVPDFRGLWTGVRMCADSPLN